LDFKEIVTMALDEYTGELRKAVDGLSPEERRFQPSYGANHVDFTVWHIARVEDDWVQRFAQGSPTVWERDGWHRKLGLPAPAEGNGYGYDAEQVAGLPRFDLDEMMAYYDSVREATLAFLDGLTAEDLDRCPQPEGRPGYSVGKMLSHVICEESQHVGHVAYLRGLQRGLDNSRRTGSAWNN
jgi:uncharacterized damage-inducible protein DinB